ncbi:MAG: ATP-dependent 6-phosphofructokinase [Verrucomicrobiota bacterium]
MKIAILNGGGDCPGLNAVTHGVVGAASKLGWETIGVRDGFEGLITPGNLIELDPEETPNIMKMGGTVLGTANKGPFSAKTGTGKVRQLPKNLLAEVKASMEAEKINSLVAVGGDGTLTAALQFHEAGIPIVGVPKTIDNDLDATAMTFGFDSAVTCVVDALDRLHTTAVSHKRVMVLEVMGRHAGWIALFGGLGGGADVILIPEIGFDIKQVAAAVEAREARAKHSTVIVVAEGAKQKNGRKLYRSTAGAGEHRLGGLGEMVAEKVGELTGKETRSVTLGHLQRGGSPTSWDRILAIRFGVHAVRLLKRRHFGRMVNYHSYEVGDAPIADAVDQLRTVNPKGQIVDAARSVGISFGD